MEARAWAGREEVVHPEPMLASGVQASVFSRNRVYEDHSSNDVLQVN